MEGIGRSSSLPQRSQRNTEEPQRLERGARFDVYRFFHGLGALNFDLALLKTTRLGESKSKTLQFRLEAFKLFFRGFADGQYTMTFDGIPFEDTNSPTHHT
jgi:hypothetical protein